MRYVSVEDARKRLGRLVGDAAAGERIVIGRRGGEQVVLLGREEFDRLQRLVEQAAVTGFQEGLAALSKETGRRRLRQDVVDEAIRAIRHRCDSSSTEFAGPCDCYNVEPSERP